MNKKNKGNMTQKQTNKQKLLKENWCSCKVFDREDQIDNDIHFCESRGRDDGGGESGDCRWTGRM